ncbi:carbohydrate ABC transporter permease [Murimonas intestini]|uniref:Aldouronate transport system permease protein n=1 Tax=Murimonas intestini TaxID=1337051 RepID=A0AB73T5X6_9FIRM|nr:carbohydrate ABC transporter permease [Murimonas intestini]MCR1841935.1 carbohydrate ABC transporter permease [Murimonas intestini]MCR1865005.1 carbohydrate ABC transporter permease [Murimonas intestini]MCR1885702.1 carbohydrate ABC transporter permease [Murimonas intestini]
MVEKGKVFQILVHFIFILLCLSCLIPFVLMIVSSFTSETSLIRDGYSFWPGEFSLDAYKYTLMDTGAFLKGYGISILVTTAGTLVSLIITTLYAYPLSRKDLPGKNAMSFFLFFTMLFNGGLIPRYMMWTQSLHIKNTYWAYILPNLLMSAFYVIMMRTYMSNSIPDEIIDAAKVDGAGEGKILIRIVVPVAKPILATLTLLTGLGYWNDWLNGLYFITNDKYYSIQVLLNRMLLDLQFLMSNASQLAGSGVQIGMLPTMGIKMAMAVLGILPMLIIYPLFQRYFVQGIAIGAVKG